MKGILKLLCVIIACAAIAVGLAHKKTSKVIKNKLRHLVYQDAVINESAQQEIAQFINEKYKSSPHEFIECLVQSFPFINTVQMEMDVKHTQHITLISDLPVLTINNKFALTAKGRLVEKNVYAEHVIKLLPDINMPSCTAPSALSAAFSSTIIKLSSTIFDRYIITWIDDEKVVLQDKQKPYFSIISNAHTLNNVKLLNACSQLEQNFELTLAGSKKAPPQLTADVRFKDQIVISKQMGGNHG